MTMFNEVPVLVHSSRIHCGVREKVDQILTDLHAHENNALQEINSCQKKKIYHFRDFRDIIEKTFSPQFFNRGIQYSNLESFQCVSMCCYQQKKLSCVYVYVQHRGTLWFKKKKKINNSLATPHPPHPPTPTLSAQR